MADKIRAEMPNAEIELQKGSGGVFEITVDGKLVFSKKQLGRFPEEPEALRLIREAAS